MNSLERAYFERLYAEDADPWSFATSAYEREKYDRTLAQLLRPYDRALEIGCSIGVLTERLATAVGDLLAVDLSATALERARERCTAVSNVRFAEMAVPGAFPQETFDLVVLSEVGYYWSDGDLALGRDRIARALAPGGDLLLVHFLPKVDEYVRDGDAVHAAFLDDPRFARVRGERADRYRIDLLRATPAGE